MESNSPTNDSILDFLYVDRARVAQFAAQLLPDGNSHLVKRQTAKTSESTHSGGLDAVVVKGTSQYQTGSSSLIEHTSDASWEKVKAVLAELQARGFLMLPEDDPHVGRLIKFEVVIEVIKQGVFNSVWEAVLNAAHMSGTVNSDAAAKMGISNLAQVLSVMPQPTIMLAVERTLKVDLWGILKDDGFVGSKDDFGLLYSGYIPGNWQLIGLLDAEPELEVEKLVSLPGSDALKGMQEAAAASRQVFGRPLTSWGVTPICIYRPVLPYRPLLATEEL